MPISDVLRRGGRDPRWVAATLALVAAAGLPGTGKSVLARALREVGIPEPARRMARSVSW